MSLFLFIIINLQVLPHIKDLGYNAIQLFGIVEHKDYFTAGYRVSWKFYWTYLSYFFKDAKHQIWQSLPHRFHPLRVQAVDSVRLSNALVIRNAYEYLFVFAANCGSLLET